MGCCRNKNKVLINKLLLVTNISNDVLSIYMNTSTDNIVTEFILQLLTLMLENENLCSCVCDFNNCKMFSAICSVQVVAK